MNESADVVIVGAGIVGTALAFELSGRGLKVTLLEADMPASKTTGSSFAWVNATAKFDDEHYHRLNAQGLARYTELAAEWSASALGIHPNGALFWTTAESREGEGERGRRGEAEPEEQSKIQNRKSKIADTRYPTPDTPLRRRVSRLQAWDYPASWLDRSELQALEPQIPFGEGAEGLFAPADLWIDTPRLIGFFCEQARLRHADIRSMCPVIGFTRYARQSITQVETPQGPIEAQRLVIAAGVETLALADRALGDPGQTLRHAVRPDPGLMIETAPGSAQGQIGRILYPPDANALHLRPTPMGGLLLGAKDGDAAIRAAIPPEASAIDPFTFPPSSFLLSPDSPDRLLQRAARLLPHLRPALLSSEITFRICIRPMPADGLPIVGTLPGALGVSIAVTHSGITLGPLIARLLAEEILTGQPTHQLEPYRPARFINSRKLGN